MKPAPFDYYAPDSLAEAVALLAKFDDEGVEAKILAGGQSLMPMLNFRLLRPAMLVDIGRIDALSGITERAHGITIGALTRHRVLETDPCIAARFPVLYEAAGIMVFDDRGTLIVEHLWPSPGIRYVGNGQPRGPKKKSGVSPMS